MSWEVHLGAKHPFFLLAATGRPAGKPEQQPPSHALEGQTAAAEAAEGGKDGQAPAQLQIITRHVADEAVDVDMLETSRDEIEAKSPVEDELVRPAAAADDSALSETEALLRPFERVGLAVSQ